MSAFHQLAHNSAKMVIEPELKQFKGVLLSPVNYSPSDTLTRCNRFREKRSDLDILFDPQLFVPQQGRGRLSTWPYMPDGLDTADYSTEAAWLPIIDEIIKETKPFAPDGICSPTTAPRAVSDGYYELSAFVANALRDRLQGSSTRAVMTAFVGLADLALPDRHLQVGSLLSKFLGKDIYLVLSDDTEPREERVRQGEMEAAARLIRLLADAGYNVIMGFTSSEMVIWKAAGAAHVASGKYWNVRRFTRGRFDVEEDGGGRPAWYWFEPSLLAFLREADLERYRAAGFQLSPLHVSNPFSQGILQKITSTEKRPVLADSWRQFLYWFAQYEAIIGNETPAVLKMLVDVEAQWTKVKAAGVKFELAHNTGAWVPAWRTALQNLVNKPD